MPIMTTEEFRTALERYMKLSREVCEEIAHEEESSLSPKVGELNRLIGILLRGRNKRLHRFDRGVQ